MGSVHPVDRFLNSFEFNVKMCALFLALIIFDETQTGLGRTGDHFWGFQNFGNIVPDILTCGRPLGAGHPIGACITSSRVARRFVQFFRFIRLKSA